MSHAYAWHASCICVAWLIRMCKGVETRRAINSPREWGLSDEVFTCAHVCIHTYMQTHMNQTDMQTKIHKYSNYTYIHRWSTERESWRVETAHIQSWRIHMRNDSWLLHMSTNEWVLSHITHECVTYCRGWRRCIGCLKMQVIFRKRATNYRALLRKMTYEDQASNES